MKSIIILSLFFVTLLSEAFGNPLEAWKELQNGQAVFLDVREKNEVDEGMIKGADWVPLSALEKDPARTIKKISELSSGKTLYVYCRSGRRSQTFIDKLKGSDLKGKNLGGYQDLIEAGLPRL